MGKYTDRVEEIKHIVAGDETATKLISDVLTKATDYVRQIERTERIIAIHSGADDFAEKFASADRLRTLKHNALISGLTATNRYLFNEYAHQIPVGGLFVGPVEQFHRRDIIGDWAVELVQEIRKEQMEREQESGRETGMMGGGEARWA